jgi:hypothetical protein
LHTIEYIENDTKNPSLPAFAHKYYATQPSFMSNMTDLLLPRHKPVLPYSNGAKTGDEKMMKTLFATAFLALSPAIAMAQCSSEHMDVQAMSCADGSTWDAATSACMPQITS